MSYAVTLFIGILIGRLVFPLPLNSCRRVWGHDWRVVAVIPHPVHPYQNVYKECRRCPARKCSLPLEVETDLEWLEGEKVGLPERQYARLTPPKGGTGVLPPHYP